MPRTLRWLRPARRCECQAGLPGKVPATVLYLARRLGPDHPVVTVTCTARYCGRDVVLRVRDYEDVTVVA